MDLATLLPALAPVSVQGPTSRPVRAVSHDSRTIGVEDIFVAIRGAVADGRRFASQLPCAAVIADSPVEVLPGVTVIRVRDARLALARAAAALSGHPARALPVVGITGTNGKTTTAHLLEAAMSGVSQPGLLLGTTGHRLAGQPIASTHTTPEAPVIQRLLERAQREGCTWAVMEVSSIGLELRRVDALPFRVAAFTSFSQDHLDFHPDMAAYFQAKARLFSELLAPGGIAVVHADDPAIGALELSHRTVLRYGRQSDFELCIHDESADLTGCSAQVTAFGQTHRLQVPLVGAHNLENAVCAFGIALALGADAPSVLKALGHCPPVPGRLERVSGPPDGPTVFVDYAHTPDALERVLAALRPLTPGLLHTVFGCGGDRDREKRPLMGQAVEAGSDRVWITSDNPRSEDPTAILADITEGLSRPAQALVDRREAIHRAILAAGPQDVVLIAGKGHETTQTIGAIAHPFDDMLVASEALALRNGGRP